MRNFTTKIFRWALSFTAFMLLAGGVRADTPEFSLAAGIGYVADSNVNIADLDQNTGADDSALDLELDIGAKLPLGETISLVAGYAYNGTRYSEFSEFDLALHQLRGGLNLTAGGFDMGLLAEHVTANLDAERYLEMRQVTPSLGKLVGNKLYLRAAFSAAEKTYVENDARDATNRSLRADAYVLLDGMDRYLSFGYVSSTEDAFDELLDFTGDRVQVGFGQRFGSGERSLKLRLVAQHEIRDYLGFDETIEDTRLDERLRAELSATLALTEWLSFEGAAAYADNRSNRDGASYTETIYRLGVGVAF